MRRKKMYAEEVRKEEMNCGGGEELFFLFAPQLAALQRFSSDDNDERME
jgi:hypothetical protein